MQSNHSKLNFHKWGRFKNWGIQSKVLTTLSCITLASIILISILGTITTNNLITQSSQGKLKSDLSVGLQLINNQFNGNWEVLNGQLWKGDTVVNGNNNIATALSQEIGDSVTIYQGGTSIATSFMYKNKFMDGTKANSNIGQAVLKSGNTYTDKEIIEGQPYEMAYQPIRDVRNHIIGIWSVGIPLSSLISQQSTFLFETIITGTIVLILGLLLGWLTTTRMVKPLKKLVTMAEKIGKGDLTQATVTESSDEIGQLNKVFNQMVSSLRSLILEVGQASEQLAASSEELMAIAEDNNLAAEKVVSITKRAAESAEHQVRSIEGSTQAVESITNGMQHIAQNSQMASASTVEAGEVCSSGSRSIDMAKQQMVSIQQSVSELSSFIQILNEHSKDIGQVVQVIRYIASQTNLLALNAAIEAARSGENGRGFAVVAEEIRKLAEQSSMSGAQISELVATIQDKVDSILQSVETSTKEVSEGIKTVDSAKQSFRQIEASVMTVIEQIQEVSAQVEHIAVGTGELSVGMDGVSNVANSASNNMRAVSATSTQQLLSMKEITSSAHALTHMAEKLQQSIDRFKI